LERGQAVRLNPERVLKGAEFVTAQKFKKLLFYPDIKSAILNGWKNGFTKSMGYLKVKFRK
jgi:hypothetical protein